jgi:putative FmdB family regulatory protein
MPIYEYRCKKCRKNFALIQHYSATENDTRCPYCNAGEVKKQMSTFSYSFEKTSSPGGFGG